MKSIISILEEEVKKAFSGAGYDNQFAKLNISKRPDLCDFQCNGAMPLAKMMHKMPLDIAQDIVKQLEASELFEKTEAVAPGFINLIISNTTLSSYVSKMGQSKKNGLEEAEKPLTIIVDYGGPNVSKPLHVGHLRPAIIGESCKRIAKYMGHNAIGDVHLGDWGLQIGLLITELRHRKPDLVYFDDSYTGEYPKEAPFTMKDLEEMYPLASSKSKEDEKYHEEALLATQEFQSHKPGYVAIWEHIIGVSVPDIKKNYDRLNVSFELWKKESDVKPYIEDMVQNLIDNKIAYYDQGALIVDIKEEKDTKEIPPCIVLKSDGSSLYTTTDLATLVERRRLFDPDRILYVVDKRQGMHFEQVFRTAYKAGIVRKDTQLDFLGNGTVNGPDGKPYKTRTGGTPKLEYLIDEIESDMLLKINENKTLDEAEAKEAASIIGLSAIKYGDLSNAATKDYIFDIDRFTSFEGNTGPYILYTIVRIKSILKKYYSDHTKTDGRISNNINPAQKDLMLNIVRFSQVIEQAYEETAPHKICSFIYELSNSFNRFYHGTSILSETDDNLKASYITLLEVSKKILEDCIDMLGFTAPERM